jgi:HSP20 family protein
MSFIKLPLLVVIFVSAVSVGTADASWWNGWFKDIPAMGSIDVNQDNDNVIVTMAVPSGVDPENIVVDIKDQTLHVYGKSEAKTEMNEEGYYKKEMSSSSFNRSVSLPCLVNDLETTAELNGNVLVITMPKINEQDKAAKKIRVVRT